MTIPHSEISSLTPTALLRFFVLDATACGGGIYYFHNDTTIMNTSPVWQGQTYTPMPIEADGFEFTSKGTLPRPRLRVAAMDGLIGGLIRDLDDLIGATVTVKRCHARHLDAINFPGSYNPTADPTAKYDDEHWVIERKSLESSDVIEFELASPVDSQNARFPKRRITANVCGWVFKGSECGYAGADATCAKTLIACKAKFPGADLPFGAFPGTARVR